MIHRALRVFNQFKVSFIVLSQQCEPPTFCSVESAGIFLPGLPLVVPKRIKLAADECPNNKRY
jgi:hypothetical protein